MDKARPIAAPFIGRIQEVEAQWADYNGHMNMAYYLVLFDRAGDDLYATFGIDEAYRARVNCTTFALEAHVTYANELKVGERVRIENQIIACDQKRVHYVQSMFRDGTSYLACVMETIISHVDLAARRTSPFPAEVLAKISAMAQAHKHLPMPPQVGHKIGLPPPRG